MVIGLKMQVTIAASSYNIINNNFQPSQTCRSASKFKLNWFKSKTSNMHKLFLELRFPSSTTHGSRAAVGSGRSAAAPCLDSSHVGCELTVFPLPSVASPRWHAWNSSQLAWTHKAPSRMEWRHLLDAIVRRFPWLEMGCDRTRPSTDTSNPGPNRQNTVSNIAKPPHLSRFRGTICGQVFNLLASKWFQMALLFPFLSGQISHEGSSFGCLFPGDTNENKRNCWLPE